MDKLLVKLKRHRKQIKIKDGNVDITFCNSMNYNNEIQIMVSTLKICIPPS